jgi:hypothetical protein
MLSHFYTQHARCAKQSRRSRFRTAWRKLFNLEQLFWHILFHWLYMEEVLHFMPPWLTSDKCELVTPNYFEIWWLYFFGTKLIFIFYFSCWMSFPWYSVFYISTILWQAKVTISVVYTKAHSDSVLNYFLYYRKIKSIVRGLRFPRDRDSTSHDFIEGVSASFASKLWQPCWWAYSTYFLIGKPFPQNKVTKM